jgi:hypothetical protein
MYRPALLAFAGDLIVPLPETEKKNISVSNLTCDQETTKHKDISN